jgi:diketogulonate reductase-like aldo/keto reductase
MTKLPRLGLGTWEIGDDPARRADEIRALRTGLDLGLTMIDTAEMYGDGRAESLVGEALGAGSGVARESFVLVSKVLPRNATRDGTAAACERSLRRLRTDHLDLYLVHWRESVPLDETFAALDRLRAAGKVRAFGVSNFDLADMEEAWALPAGARIAANQVYYNLLRRGIERRLLPACAARGVTVMAYTPVESGRLPVRPSLAAAAALLGVSPFAAAVAWTMRHPSVVAVVKTGRAERVREYAKALGVHLLAEELAALDRDYPAPDRDIPLETV